MVGLVVLAGGAALAAIAIDLPWASRDAPARAALEVTTVFVAALAACLLYGRAGGRGRDLTLAWGIGLFAVVEAAFSLLPAIMSRQVDGVLLGADAIAGPVIVLILAAAALAPAHLIDPAGRRTAYAMGAALLGFPLTLLAIAAVQPVNVSAALAAANPPTGLAAAHLAAMLLAVLAAAAFVWRSLRDGGELQAWLGAAVVLLGGAHLYAAVNPVHTLEWVTTGDLLCGAAALLLLAGALRQLGTYLGAAGRRAVAEERRRIARDLHDGLAQELAYIAAHAPRVAAQSDDPAAARIAEAAACALDESRLAIASLADESQESLGPALVRAAERIASRAGGVVRADLQEGVEVEAAVRGHLLRIVREATTNAVRHGGASEVSLSLTEGEAVVLQIADDGAGFGPDDDGADGLYSGFGLSSMQERAERAGGHLRVRCGPGGGTIVEVRLG